jgi:hypothetical protein
MIGLIYISKIRNLLKIIIMLHFCEKEHFKEDLNHNTIGPSPGTSNWSTDRVKRAPDQTSRTSVRDKAHACSHAPDRADAPPIMLTDPMRPRPHVTQLFSAFAQSFCNIISHFLILVNHFAAL